MLSTYAKILQPDTQVRWLGNEINLFEEGLITAYQDLMNLAAIKYNKIINVIRKFQDSAKTIQEDIVAMLAHTYAAKREFSAYPDRDKDGNSKSTKRNFTPFLIHYQTANKVK